VSPIISGMLLCCKKIAGPLVRAPLCGGPCSAKHAEHALIRLCMCIQSLYGSLHNVVRHRHSKTQLSSRPYKPRTSHILLKQRGTVEHVSKDSEVTKRTSHPAAGDKQQDVSASDGLASAAKVTVSPSINISRLIISVFTVRLRMHRLYPHGLAVDIRLLSVCQKRSCTLLRRWKFSAIFLRHLVQWPPMTFQ